MTGRDFTGEDTTPLSSYTVSGEGTTLVHQARFPTRRSRELRRDRQEYGYLYQQLRVCIAVFRVASEFLLFRL
jgi:hypothetical protein